MPLNEYISVFGRRRPKFRFSLITDYINIQEIPNAPEGWDKVSIDWARSDTYFGMVRSFIIPLSYVKDGAILLRKAFYGNPDSHIPGRGMEANVQTLIEKFNTDTFDWDFVYQGSNDFSTFEDHGIEEGDIVVINVTEGGITKMVKAYEDQKYSILIPTTGPDSKIITLTPIKLKEKAQFIIPYTNPFQSSNFFPALQIITNEQKAIDASVQDVTFFQDPLNLPSNGGKWFLRPRCDTKVRVKGSINVHMQGGQFVRVYNSAGGIVATLFGVPDNSPDVTTTINIDTSFQAVQYETYYIYVASQGLFDFAINSGDLLLQYDTISAATDVFAVTPTYLFQQLMNKMVGDVLPVPIQSYLLKQWDNLLLTSGNAIKPFTPLPIYSDGSINSGNVYLVSGENITYNGHVLTPGTTFTATSVPTFTGDGYVLQKDAVPKIIISWKQFWQSINSMLGAGWGVQTINKVSVSVLEKKSYWYSSTLPITNIGKVKKGKVSPYVNYMYSGVQVGYADQKYDQINGVTEFNSTNYFSFPVTTVNKILDLISVIRADSTGIELLRVGLNQSSSGSSDTGGNNDTFAIYCIPGGTQFIPEPATAFGMVTGLETNLYNLRVSPGENLRRHSDFLAGMLYQLQGYSIKFTSGLKNVNLSRIGSNGLRVTENSDIPVTSLGLPLFIPIQIPITCKEPINMTDLLRSSNTGAISGEFDGISFDGFILDCTTDIAYNTQQDINLLLTPNNNLFNFVR